MHGSTTGECERVWEVLRVPFPDRAYLPILTELIAKRPGPTHFEERHLNRPESCPIPCPLSLFPSLLFRRTFIYRYTDRDTLAAWNRKEPIVIESDNYFRLWALSLLWNEYSLFSFSETCNNGKFEFYIYVEESVALHSSLWHTWTLEIRFDINVNIRILFQTILTLCNIATCDSYSVMHVRPLFLFFIHCISRKIGDNVYSWNKVEKFSGLIRAAM